MGYKVMVECRDCTGVDDYGCGDGRPWWLGEWDDEPTVYATREEAEAAIVEDDTGAPYIYTIEEL
jgi:hypothetical protein